jgi:hypothetical protein
LPAAFAANNGSWWGTLGSNLFSYWSWGVRGSNQTYGQHNALVLGIAVLILSKILIGAAHQKQLPYPIIEQS